MTPTTDPALVEVAYVILAGTLVDIGIVVWLVASFLRRRRR